jgi:hypothetical protein
MSNPIPTESREASATMRFDPPSARFRVKGKRLRVERWGETLDFRVVAVSYPDEWGVCTLELEPWS